MNNFSNVLRPATRAILAGAAALACAFPALADVAEYVPNDALVMFKVNNIQAVSQEAGALAREFGLTEMAGPQAGNPLGSFKSISGLKQGIRDDGDMAVYLVNGDMEGEDPPIVVLIPITDFETFVGNFTNVKAAEGAQGVQVGQAQGEDVYMVDLGEYAAIAPTAENLRPNKPEQAIQLSGVSAERLDERDVVVYANFQQLAPMLKQHMEENDVRGEAERELREGLEENEMAARFGPVAEAFLNQGFGLVDTFLQDAIAAEITLDFSEGGIGMGVLAQFQPDSYMANLLGDLNATQDTLLDGIPEGTYLFYGGSVGDPETSQKLFNDLFGPIVAELEGVEGADVLREYIDVIKTQVTAAGDTRFGMFAPQGPLGGGSPVIQQFVIQGGDVEALKNAQRKATELMPKLITEFASMSGEEVPAGAIPSMEYTEDAKTVAGVEFDKLSTSMGEDAANAEMQMQMLFGPEGPTTYLGTVDDKLLVINGLTDEQIASVVSTVKEGEAPLTDTPGLEMVKSHLPSNRSAVMYFQPDELVHSGLNLARPFIGEVAIQLPEDLPPVGFAVGPVENSVQAELFISKDVISAMIVAALQAQQHFGGQQGPGGGL